MYSVRGFTASSPQAGIFVPHSAVRRSCRRGRKTHARVAAPSAHSLLAQWLNVTCFSTLHETSSHNKQESIQLARQLIDVIQPRRLAKFNKSSIPRIESNDPILQELPRAQQPRPPSYILNGPSMRFRISKILNQLITEQQYEKSIRYYNYKLKLGLKPTHRILYQRLRASAYLKDVEGAVRVLRQAERYSVRPTREFFNKLISVCAASKHTAHYIPQIVEKMGKYALDVDSATYVTIMTVYVETDQIKAALNLYYQMQRTRARLPPQLEIRFIGALKRIAAYDEALKIFEPLWKRFGEKFGDANIISEAGTVGLDLYLKMGNPTKAHEFWNEMRSRGIRPHTDMIVTLAESFKAQGLVGLARSLFQQVRFHVRPTLELYNVMIDVYGRHVSADAALNKYEQLRRLYIPDKGTLRSLLSMLHHLAATKSNANYRAVLAQSLELAKHFNEEYKIEVAAHEDVTYVFILLVSKCGDLERCKMVFLDFSRRDTRRSLLIPEAMLQALHTCGVLSTEDLTREMSALRDAAESALEGIEKSRLGSTDLLLSAETMSQFVAHVEELCTHSVDVEAQIS